MCMSMCSNHLDDLELYSKLQLNDAYLLLFIRYFHQFTFQISVVNVAAIPTKFTTKFCCIQFSIPCAMFAKNQHSKYIAAHG